MRCSLRITVCKEGMGSMDDHPPKVCKYEIIINYKPCLIDVGVDHKFLNKKKTSGALNDLGIWRPNSLIGSQALNNSKLEMIRILNLNQSVSNDMNLSTKQSLILL